MTGDRPRADLVAFYKSLRALLRAKIAIWHVHDDSANVAKWRARALAYLALAEQYTH